MSFPVSVEMNGVKMSGLMHSMVMATCMCCGVHGVVYAYASKDRKFVGNLCEYCAERRKVE
jgi:hypothetical protein